MGKSKEIVQLRQRVLKDGRVSLYLTYRLNGKRYYDYPRLYLLPSSEKGSASKNKETMRVALALQAKMILELTQNRAGIEVVREPSKLLLSQWVEHVLKVKEETTRGVESVHTIASVYRHVMEYAGEKAKLSDIDKRFCEGFISYLRKAKGKFGEPLSPVTKREYLSKFGTLIRMAVRDGLLPYNPLDRIDPKEKFPSTDSERTYLTIDEVRRIAVTDTKRPIVKQAFMFACFCGLRISDIKQLRWKDMEEFTDLEGNKRVRLTKRMQKTQRNVSYILSNEAIKWLPEKKGELVFEGLPCLPNICVHVKRLAKDAGIDKVVSFHTARHTFATMMLTLGADLYTTSKLLGHSRITTTEIYAKIVDKKKDEAMGLIDKFFDD